MTSQYIGDKLAPIYCDVIASVRIRESMTSHGHMTHQEKDRIFRGSDDEDLFTLSPIYCDVIARLRKYRSACLPACTFPIRTPYIFIM